MLQYNVDLMEKLDFFQNLGNIWVVGRESDKIGRLIDRFGELIREHEVRVPFATEIFGKLDK